MPIAEEIFLLCAIRLSILLFCCQTANVNTSVEKRKNFYMMVDLRNSIFPLFTTSTALPCT
jgi:hypothetical protein